MRLTSYRKRRGCIHFTASHFIQGLAYRRTISLRRTNSAIRPAASSALK